MKKLLIVIICFIAVLTTALTLGLTRDSYNVFASTVMDYNLVDFNADSMVSLNVNSEITFLETGFIIEIVRLPAGNGGAVSFGYSLIPNTQYILTYSAEKLVEGSHNRVIVRNSDDTSIKSAIDENSLTFTTDSVGTGRIQFFVFWSSEGVDKFYKTKYYDIKLQFTDENLGAAYVNGYNSGYYEGAKPYEEDWEVFIFEDDSLIKRRWKEGDTIQNPGSQGDWHRSSVLLTLPLGYYRIEQRFLDITGYRWPRFFDPTRPGQRDYPPILYLDENSIYRSLDFVGKLNEDQYIYFSVPYDNCQVRFQFTELTGDLFPWSSDITSLYQLIELSFDANFNIRYYEIYKRGYDVGKVDGYSEGKNDGIEAGYWSGYNDGKNDGLSTGYNEGYNEGYNIGFNEGSSSSITTSWFTSFIDSIFNIFNVEIFPNVRLIYLIFIPLGLGVIALIFKLIRG